MTTRREILTNKYNELLVAIKPLFPNQLLPTLDDYDLCDVLFFINFTFPDENIQGPLRHIVAMNCNEEVDEMKFQSLVNILLPFLQWYKNLE
jgi:hypothetical protein